MLNDYSCGIDYLSLRPSVTGAAVKRLSRRSNSINTTVWTSTRMTRLPTIIATDSGVESRPSETMSVVAHAGA